MEFEEMELIVVSMFFSFCALVMQFSEFLVCRQSLVLPRPAPWADRPPALVPETEVVCVGSL
jgi:hypothetical protein